MSRTGLRALESGAIDTGAITTHGMPLKNVVEALRLMGIGEVVKVAIIPS